MGDIKHLDTADDGAKSDAKIDISPLIDCVFILLIFFIVTTAFIEERGFETDRATAGSDGGLGLENEKIVVIRVTKDGSVVYRGAKQSFSNIRSIVHHAGGRESNVVILIEAEREAAAGLLVRAVDDARRAGARQVKINALAW